MVKIKSMIRKSVNCLVTLSLMFFVFLFVYACSSDVDYSAISVFTTDYYSIFYR